MPSGLPINPITTNHRFPPIDWQIRAVTIFSLVFAEDLTHLDTTLVGVLFLGAWAPSWALIVLESLRACNGYGSHWTSWITIPGIVIFNQGHAVFSSLWLAVLVIWQPSGYAGAAELAVGRHDAVAIVVSFVVGYVIPIVLSALPAPGYVSWKVKQSVCGLYQQWNVWIVLVHHACVYVMRRGDVVGIGQAASQSPEESWRYLRLTYSFVFLLAAVPWWIVLATCAVQYLRRGSKGRRAQGGSLFKQVFVPTLPFASRKCRGVHEGFKWLIQWDHIIGTLATCVWAFVLYDRFLRAHGVEETGVQVIWKCAMYAAVGGPVAIPVGLLYERDRMALARLD